MEWIDIVDEKIIEDIQLKSHTKMQAIFKHSTTCSISSVAKSRLERSGIPETIDFYYLDLIKYRGISKAIADVFEVQHESPQILLIKNGMCVYDESHYGINVDKIIELLESA